MRVKISTHSCKVVGLSPSIYATGQYAEDKTMVQAKKRNQPETGINVECADKGKKSQTEEGKLQFYNVPERDQRSEHLQ